MTPRGSNRTLQVILAAYACYALAFIFRTSFLVGGVRYFALFDDAMISMRYAKNLAAGYGLVYNPGGPRVEGFTNPLWTFYMAAVHLAPIPAPKIALVIQLTGAACLAATVALVWRLVLRLTQGSSLCAAAGAVLTAFYLPLNNWTLQGFEVGPLALLVTFAIDRAADALTAERFDPTVYYILGAATLIRLDALVPALAITAFLLIVDPRHRPQHALRGLGALALLTAAQTGVRLWYFGYPFPNTYYLKMTGYPAAMRVARGVLVMLAFVWRLNVLLCAAVLLVLASRSREPLPWLLASTAAAVFAYSIYVGGDAWEWWGGSNRYVSVVMPLFFALLATTLHDAGMRLFGAPPRGIAGALAVAVFTAACVVNVNYLRRATSLRELALVDPPFTVLETAQYVATSRRVARVADKDARLAVVQAGTLPYFSDREAIDMLGKTDARIAHEPMHAPATAGLQRVKDFLPGHMKWDFSYAIGELKPDIIVELGRFPGESLAYVRAAYRVWHTGNSVLYLRSDSPHIDWGLVRSEGTLSDIAPPRPLLLDPAHPSDK